MVVVPVIKLSPNLASKGSEAPMARFVEPSSEAGSIAGQPLRKRSPSTHSGCFCCLAANQLSASDILSSAEILGLRNGSKEKTAR
jgi:hypothetical protein